MGSDSGLSSRLERGLLASTPTFPLGLFATDREGKLTYANERWLELAGTDLKETLREGWAHTVHPEDRERVLGLWTEALASGAPFHEEFRFLRKDGVVFWLMVAAGPEFDRQGALAGYVATVTDVTRRRVAEETLREREARLRSLLRSAVDGIVLIDEKGTIQSFNPAAERMFGYAAHEVLGRNVRMLMPSPDHEEHDGYLRNYLATGQAKIIGIGREVRGRRKDGTTFPLQLGVSEVRDDSRSFVGILRDISAEKKVEHDLRESRRTLSTLVGNLPGMAYRCRYEPRRTMELVSAGCEKLLGHTAEELVKSPHLSYADLIHQDDREEVWALIERAVASRSPYRLDYRIRVSDGSFRWVWEQGCGVFSATGGVLALEGFVTDVTDKKRLEQEFLQAQKMEAVGRLAGGIAHDFNNLLTGIISGCRIAESLLPEGSPAAAILGEVRREARRGAGLTRQLLDFSRKSRHAPRAIHLNDVVVEARGILEKLLGEDIELGIELDPSESVIVADPVQIEQILLNLCINARDAMPHGGTLEIRIRGEDVSTDRNGISAGSYARLSVRDTGHGMSPEVLEHVFEPFFTTKEVGKGTGLGLSTVFGLVKQFGGHLRVESAPGRGSTFELYFPRTSETVPTAPAAREERAVCESVGATVLVVEDESLVRAGIRHSLENLGYQVLCAASPSAALRLLEAHPGRVGLLLTDIVMPEMSGPVLAERVRERLPHIRVLFMSAYNDQTLIDQGRLEPGTTVLEKPFEEEKLARLVAEALSDPPPR